MNDKAKAAFINGLLKRPYRLGAAGPDEFDCWGLTRLVQRDVYGRDLPLFEMAVKCGRMAMAAVIAAHPERKRWRQIPRPVDGALISMAQQGRGYHLGTFVALDGGLIVHTLEESGVVADRAVHLRTLGWHSIKWYVPDDSAESSA